MSDTRAPRTWVLRWDEDPLSADLPDDERWEILGVADGPHTERVTVIEAEPVLDLLERLIHTEPQNPGYSPRDHILEDAVALLKAHGRLGGVAA